ncbi:Glycosyltransferase sdnJ [Colletotrichum sidae]|uniref:Glycosyltransferase sdnJ n=1 Tax=Colletotrichum sidae TaxID=1347389 RepID=A0A4R8TDC1_9PEZI|nr:Glycosyltransferase sdnJ [Colletotrichum sidae]
MTRRKVLLLTNSEHGQANVFLATSYALLAAAPDTEIHFASFGGIKAAVQSTSDAALEANPGATPIRFHQLDGTSVVEALLENPAGLMDVLDMRPGPFTTHRILPPIARASMPYTGPQIRQNCAEVRRVVEEVRPDLTVVDNLFTPGLTVARELGVEWMILSPNTLKEFAAPLQPRGAYFWKFPALCTAYPFPVPLHLIPLNILFHLMFLYYIFFDKQGVQARKYLKEEAHTELFDQGGIFADPPPGLKILIATSPAFDFPVETIPDNMIPCGPILRPVRPVGEADAELDRWLGRGPTVVINLGTHSWAKETKAAKMATAIRRLLDAWREAGEEGRLQVLWKLKQTGDGRVEYDPYREDGPIAGILGGEFDNDLVRVVSWVKAEPYAVLRTGQVVCSVNHGGANSFWEALCAGVPQVILPVWADTFDFAHRAELLGIGRWGSRKHAPGYGAEELGAAMKEVVVGDGARKLRQRAKAVAKERESHGEGHDVAAKHILQALASSGR